jgi:hypothetical protein
MHLALTQPATYGALVGRILPQKVEAEGTVTLEALILSARRALEAEEAAGPTTSRVR